MHHEELIYKLEQLDPATPVSITHILALLKTLTPLLDKAKAEPAKAQDGSWGDERLIDEKQLSELMSVPVETLRYWRKNNIGPEITYVQTSVRYQLGHVRNYIKTHTVKNAAAGRTLNLKERKKRIAGFQSNASVCDYSFQPVILYGKEEVDFFDSIQREETPTGYRIYVSDDPFPTTALTDEKLRDILERYEVSQ